MENTSSGESERSGGYITTGGHGGFRINKDLIRDKYPCEIVVFCV